MLKQKNQIIQDDAKFHAKMLGIHRSSQRGQPRAAVAAASLGNLLEMQILRPHFIPNRR